MSSEKSQQKQRAMPVSLSDAARAVWPEVEAELAGLPGDIDGIALRMFCETFARWKQATEIVAKHGAVIKAPSGYPVQSPFLTIANKTQEQLVKLMVEFGLASVSEKNVGKREERKRAAASATRGKFAPGAPPRLVVNNK